MDLKQTVPDLENGAKDINSNSEKKNKCKNPDQMHAVLKQIEHHPEYRTEFLKTSEFLIYGNGPLPTEYRHYLAIMAASRHQCHTLMNYHKKQFLANGGDINWLRGLQYCPKKLRKLNQINTILARTPWLLQKCHLTRLNKNRHTWAAGELCQALVLLCHFHSFCSFVFAGQILNIIDDTNPEKKETSDSDNCEEDSQDTVDELMEKMNLIQQREDDEKNVNPYDLPANHCDKMDECPTINNPEQRKPFYIHDCSWDYHAYSILNRYYDEVGTVLDAKFKVAYDLTYYTMGHKQNVDTTIFRRAVWNYIHRIYGIIHEDYNYEEIADLLDEGFRSYIDTVVFCPEKITKDNHDIIMRAFRHSEKVHVNLMIFEARLQSELLYALSVIMKYMA